MRSTFVGYAYRQGLVDVARKRSAQAGASDTDSVVLGQPRTYGAIALVDLHDVVEAGIALGLRSVELARCSMPSTDPTMVLWPSAAGASRPQSTISSPVRRCGGPEFSATFPPVVETTGTDVAAASPSACSLWTLTRWTTQRRLASTRVSVRW
jgi:hypothetical protein